MKKIIIRAGNIASVCRVDIDGVEQRYIYVNKNEIVHAEDHDPDTQHGLGTNAIEYEDLPIDVASEVKAHFDKLFAVPLDGRGKAVNDSPVVGIMKDVHCEADGLVETISLLVDTLHPDLPQDEQNELIHEEGGYLDTLRKDYMEANTYRLSVFVKEALPYPCDVYPYRKGDPLRKDGKKYSRQDVATLIISAPRGDHADYKIITTKKITNE